MAFNKEISEELIKMAADDQAAIKDKAWNNELGQKHVNQLKKIIEKIGWPTISTVGKEASEAAWLIVQHADFDIEFQKSCLVLIEHAAKIDEAALPNIAYLTDRILVNLKKPQKFGTQFYIDEKGVFGPRPIENEKGVDALRAKYKLPPLKEYKELMMKLHKPQ